MLINHVQERGSGKTTEIIKRMEKENNIIVMVLNRHHKKLFPLELRKRIIVLSDLEISTMLNDIKRNYGLLLIDEGYCINPAESAKLFYTLGSYDINVEVYGTFK